MFDKNKPNAVILTDLTTDMYLQKPLGAHKIAHELRRAGYEVFVLNHLHMFTIEEIKHILSNTVNANTVFVGISGFFYSTFDRNGAGITATGKQFGAMIPHGAEYNQEIKQLIKDINPNTKLVMGGPMAIDRSYTQDYDYVVSGYGDTSIVNLANHLYKQEPLQRSRRSLFGPTLIENIKSEGYDFANMGMFYADHDFILPGETLTIEVSRGCIFSCKFCSFPLTGKQKNDYIKNFGLLRQELVDNYERFGVTRYQIADETLNESVEKIEFLHRVSKSLPFKLEYWAHIRLDLLIAHPHTIELLVDSGLRGAFFGIETMHEGAASIIGKAGKRDRLLSALTDIKQTYGDQLQLTGSFIFGLPTETRDSMIRTGEMLINGEIPLDTWRIYSLKLLDKVWKSDMDINYEAYGYRILDTVADETGNIKIWENDYITYAECDRLAKLYESNANNCLASTECISIAGMGIDLDSLFNKPHVQQNWNLIRYVKQKRFKLYKSKVYDFLGITT